MASRRRLVVARGKPDKRCLCTASVSPSSLPSPWLITYWPTWRVTSPASRMGAVGEAGEGGSGRQRVATGDTSSPWSFGSSYSRFDYYKKYHYEH